jgi:hypothetical protein
MAKTSKPYTVLGALRAGHCGVCGGDRRILCSKCRAK